MNTAQNTQSTQNTQNTQVPQQPRAGQSILAWQWETYTRNHTTRNNLLIHIFAVPLVWAGTFLWISAFVNLASSASAKAAADATWQLVLAGIVCQGLGMALQGRGHKQEAEPPIPFTGPANAITRIVLEQFVTFPRFVLSGAYGKAWRESAGT